MTQHLVMPCVRLLIRGQRVAVAAIAAVAAVAAVAGWTLRPGTRSGVSELTVEKVSP